MRREAFGLCPIRVDHKTVEIQRADAIDPPGRRAGVGNVVLAKGIIKIDVIHLLLSLQPVPKGKERRFITNFAMTVIEIDRELFVRARPGV